MSADPQKARSIFLEAVERTPDQRGPYLDAACGQDQELRGRVEVLLRAHEQANSLLDAPGPALLQTVDEPPAESPGAVIGPYRLLEPIGEGGFGVVFLAEQQHPVRRRVALKVLKPGVDTRQVVARFEAERQALALMDHPNIAKVLDGGETAGGRPYFVMELVKGIPITDYCDQCGLTTRERLDLFLSVCRAVQHAHQKGVIHRDLKPSNVLVAMQDGKPAAKVIDFGVAKALNQRLSEHTLVTGFHQMVGTPLYMSPEQAEMSPLDVDTRADIYSLGVLLYELLTGTTPLERERLKEAGYDELRHLIRDEEPPRPSTRLSTLKDRLTAVASRRRTDPRQLLRAVRGELDWIVMRALEKDRNRRYDTANAFALDVQRYLADEPVEASPRSRVYRLGKFLRRNKGPVMAASLAFFLLIAGITGTTWGLLRADRNRRNAETALAAETEARRHAMAALRSMTDEIVQNQMARETQLSDEQKEFLRKIIKQFEGFAAITSDGAESRAIRAEGLARVGLIRHRLGELKEAEAALSEAVRHWKQLAADFPDRPSFRQELANNHANLGILLRETGRWQEAKAAYTETLAIYKRLTADFPADPDYRQSFAQTCGNLGNLLGDAGRTNEAETAYADAVAIQRQLAADFPNRPDFRRDLALSNSNLGNLLRATGQLKKAEGSLADALVLQKQLVKAFPNRPEFRQDLAASHLNRGVLLRAAGRWKDAEGPYAEARSVYKRLAADFPAVPEFRHRLALSENNLATVLAATKRFRDAEAACSDAVAIQRKLVADFPARADFRRQLALLHNTLGSLLRDAGRFAEAEDAFANAVAISRQLTADQASAPEFRKELASIHNNRGVLFRVTGRLAEAQSAYADAAAIKKQLAADFPTQPDLRHSLAGTLGNLAIVCTQRGDFPAAKASLEEAMPHHRAALKANPRHPDYRKFYRVNLRALAAAYARVNDRAGALRVARTSRALGWDPPTDTYNAARNLAQCIPIARKLERLDAAQRRAAEQFYAEQAMALLREAVARGWKNVAQTKKDPDLDGLRQREDFQQLLKDLERD
jgi:eukaryotic-like serine/threonine-protein kinase